MQIVELFVLGHVSYVLSRRLNVSQLIKESFPELNYWNYLRDIPVAKDVSYLPEEYADIAARELQQLDRNNRNLPVSKLLLILEKDRPSYWTE